MRTTTRKSTLQALALVAGVVALAGFALVQVRAGAGTPSAPISPLYGVGIPSDYRKWQVISVAQEAGDLDSLRVILGNRIAAKAYQEGTLPFPDGAELAKVAWKRVPSPEAPDAHVPGPAQTVQFMIKDSKRYGESGGWGFGRFVEGRPADEAQHRTCFACHAALVKDHDRVFTRLPKW